MKRIANRRKSPQNAANVLPNVSPVFYHSTEMGKQMGKHFGKVGKHFPADEIKNEM